MRSAYHRGVRWLMLAALLGCKSSDSKPTPAAGKPPDEMDEKMRHCPLALDGAVSTLDDIDGGVRFTIQVPDTAIAEARRRAHHIVEFAAKRTREGHGEFDGKGGGRMKNCPVVTDGVTIMASDVDGGAQLDIVSEPGHIDELRAESRERAEKFPFVGAKITVKHGSSMR